MYPLSFAHVVGGLKCPESLSDVLRLYTSYKRRLCSLLRPRYWWAQVDSSHSPTYRAFILRISAVFVPSPTLLVGSSGFEPPTLRLSGARSNHLSYEPVSLYVGGDEGIRTLDPLLAGQVLSQLSYTPVPLYFRSPGLFPLLGSLFSLRFSSSSRAMKTEQQASVPDSVLLLFFCRDSFFLYLDF